MLYRNLIKAALGICICGLLAACARAPAIRPDAAAALPAPATAETVAAGKRLYVRCIACHATSATAPRGTGPHLVGIIGRRAASLEGYPYTASMRTQDYVWTVERLDRWLKRPQEHVPGLCLPFTGMPRAKERHALIAYLATLTP